MRPHEDALEHLGPCRRRTGPTARSTPATTRRPLVEAERDPRRVPEQQRRHDPGDHGQDQVGLAEVAALEARRPLDLADRRRRRSRRAAPAPRRRRPAARTSPGGRATAASRRGDRADHRDQDRREEHEEAPEDRTRASAPGTSRWSSLLLAEHDHGLVARRAAARRRSASTGLPSRTRSDQQLRAAGEQGAGDASAAASASAPATTVYERAAPFCSSAVIAGTISCRSPITA